MMPEEEEEGFGSFDDGPHAVGSHSPVGKALRSVRLGRVARCPGVDHDGLQEPCGRVHGHDRVLLGKWAVF